MNPYQPPLSEFAPRMRVRSSRMKLDEWQNITGSRILGGLGWLQFKLALGLLDRQVVPTPKSLANELCDESDIPQSLLNYLQSMVKGYESNGFHTPLYCVTKSQGIPVTGAAIRLLHDSSSFFLAAVASQLGPTVDGNTMLVTMVTDDEIGRTLLITSSGRKRFRPSSRTRVRYQTGEPLPVLLESHARWLTVDNIEPDSIQSLDDLHDAVDWMNAHYVDYMLERRIFQPLPE